MPGEQISPARVNAKSRTQQGIYWSWPDPRAISTDSIANSTG